ncbi:MAG: hypothetical protein ACRDTJ_28780 [Pseudonocardiaceae bacterium]
MTTQQIDFMSPEHVAVMNGLLRDSAAVRDACKELDRPHRMVYRLANGPGGRDVHWCVTFHETVRFELCDHSAPDVLLTGDWRAMIRALHDARAGEASSPELVLTGDQQVFERLSAIFEVARGPSTIVTVLPDPA